MVNPYELTDNDREVLSLVREGLNIEEIAKRRGITVQAVYSARKSLRDRYKKMKSFTNMVESNYRRHPSVLAFLFPFGLKGFKREVEAWKALKEAKIKK